MKRVSVFVVLRPERTWDGKVTTIKADRLLVQRPKLANTEVAVQLHLDVDERLFEQFLPEVIVPITGERQLVVPSVEVEDQPDLDLRDQAPDLAAERATDSNILEALRKGAVEGNQLAMAVLEGRQPWDPGTAHPRFERWLERAKRVVAEAEASAPAGTDA